MSNLMKSIAKKQNYTYTENNALTHKTTESTVLDFFYHAPARRGQDNTLLFSNALSEDVELTLKALFYLRDIRGGQGERKTFRDCLEYLYENDGELFEKIVTLVPFYGRWDDILMFTDNPIVELIVKSQLDKDLDSERPSLLAKWMPSINTTSRKTVDLAYKWAKNLNLTPKEYRLMLSNIRRKINLVESKMSDNEWQTIEYDKVPSRASMLYRKAFGRHDPTGYASYLKSVEKGEKKINARTLYPYELVEKVFEGERDKTLDILWKNLPNFTNTDVNALVVADTSGSMSGRPIAVSISLAMYLAERNRGIFKNYFITFSAKPELQKIMGRDLVEKVRNLSQAHWDQNTNLQAVFELILDTAVDNKVSEDEMPDVIFVVSDMEFDEATARNQKTNFEAIEKKYRKAGYEMPKLVFWNVSSRNNQTPVTQDQNGVYLVSGCSPSIFEKAINTSVTNPYDMMLEVLNGERYELVSKALEY